MTESLKKDLSAEKFYFWWNLSITIADFILLILNIVLVCLKWDEYCLTKQDTLFTRGLLIGLLSMAILYSLKIVFDSSKHIKNTKAILEGLENGNINITVGGKPTSEEVVEVKDGKIQVNLGEGSEATINIK